MTPVVCALCGRPIRRVGGDLDPASPRSTHTGKRYCPPRDEARCRARYEKMKREAATLDRASASSPDAVVLLADGRPGLSQPRSEGGTMAASKDTATKKDARPERGASILDTLMKRVEAEVDGQVERKPNPSGTYTRLLTDGKAFAYVFPPGKDSVAVKIPRQLRDVAAKLPSGHGFKVGEWGLTKTVKAASEVPKVAKALAVAADAVKRDGSKDAKDAAKADESSVAAASA